METKICSKCKQEFPATLEYFHSMKKGKYGVRSTCKICTEKYRKIYTSTPEYKEKHAEYARIWRYENPEKQQELAKKSREKHKDIYNKKRNEKRKNDIEWKNERDRKNKIYRNSEKGRAMLNKPQNVENSRLRSKKTRIELSEHYLRQLIKNENKLNIIEIPIELYETKKLIIELKRIIKPI